MRRFLLAFLAGLTLAGVALAQYPSQRGVSFQIGTVPRHRHSGDSDGGGTLQFDAILRDGSTNYGPVAGTTNTHVNLGTLSIAGDSIAGQDRRYATVGGGLTNHAYGEYSTIGGGFSNRLTTGTATAGTIGGGYQNRAGFQATVGGGRSNLATGNNSTIPGGLLNTAEGANAFAAGTQARSRALGAFTLSDSQAADLINDTTDFFLARFKAGWEVKTPTAVYQNRVEAGSFVGDGSGLTGISGSGFVAGSDASGRTATFDRVLATGTAPSLTATGAQFGSSITVRATAGQNATLFSTAADDFPLTWCNRTRSAACAIYSAWLISNGGVLSLYHEGETVMSHAYPSTYFNSSGLKLGIGTASPASKLHVSSGPLTLDGSGGGVIYGDAATYPRLSLLNASGAQIFYNASNFIEVANGSMRLAPGSGPYMYATANGWGIGTASPCSTCAVQAVGNINATGSLRQGTVKSCSTGLTSDADGKIDGCVPSDKKLKQGVKDLGKRVAVIDRLRPVVYRWKKGFRTYEKTPRAGFIAQEVREVFPEAVVPAGEDTLGIDANAINALLVAEVKALRVRVQKVEDSKPPTPAKSAGTGAAGAIAGAALAAAALKKKKAAK